MNIATNCVGFFTITHKEVSRVFRIWTQTLLPPVITMTLYFILFGNLIGDQLSSISGYTYMQYITPGLIMMSVVTNSYINVSSSVYGAKFVRSIEEILISPLSEHTVVLGYISGGIIRSALLGVLVLLVSLFFTHLTVHHPLIMIMTGLLTAALFSLAGFINGIFANSFDDVSIVPTFILTPLTYLGGVFFSIQMLPELWQKIALLNPIFHMINAFRYGLLGISDVSVLFALTILTILVIVLYAFCVVILKKGIRIKS